MCGLAWLARKAFQFSLILAVISRCLTFAWVTPFVHVLATVGHKVSNYRKYGILRAAEEVVRAGVLSYAPGGESVHTCHLSHFIDWSAFVGLGLVVGAVLFALLSFCSLTNLCDRVINRWPVWHIFMTATVVMTSAALSKKNISASERECFCCFSRIGMVLSRRCSHKCLTSFIPEERLQSSSPPALAWSPPPSMYQSPAQHHWCWPGPASPHPAHHHWGWPWFGISVFSLALSILLYLPTFPSPPSWPAWAYCPARRSHFFSPPFPIFPLVIALSSPSIFSLYSRLPPPLPLSSALVVSRGVCPKWLGPTWQHLL